MKLTANTKALSKALQNVAVAGVRTPTLPILSHVKLLASKGTLTLCATDLDLFAQDSIDVETETDGELTACLPLLRSLLSRIQSSEVTLTSVDKGKILEVKGGETIARFDTLPADEFPPDAHRWSGKSSPCEAGEIKAVFGKLAFAISKDASRYILTGINIAPNGSGTDFCATNGTLLATFHSEATITDKSVIVPDCFVRAVLKLEIEGTGEVSVGESTVGLSFGRTRISTKLIEGSFPNWKQVIPSKNTKAFACGRQDLMSAVQTCAVFSDTLPGLNLTGKGKELEVEKEGRATVKLLGSDLSGQPKLSIRFNARHMLETLGVMDGESVRIECEDDSTPMMIREKGFRAVLVPITRRK